MAKFKFVCVCFLKPTPLNQSQLDLFPDWFNLLSNCWSPSSQTSLQDLNGKASILQSTITAAKMSHWNGKCSAPNSVLATVIKQLCVSSSNKPQTALKTNGLNPCQLNAQKMHNKVCRLLTVFRVSFLAEMYISVSIGGCPPVKYDYIGNLYQQQKTTNTYLLLSDNI